MHHTGGYRKNRPVPRRAKQKSRFLDTLKMLLVMSILVVVAVFGIKLWKGDGQLMMLQGGTFLDNIYVNGTKLEGLTFEEGMELMDRQIEARMNTPITLSYESLQWQITPKMLNAKLEVQNDMAKAFNFGHVGSATSIRDQIESLKLEPLIIDTPISYDAELLRDYIRQIKAKIDVEPIAAQTVAHQNEQFQVSASRDGLWLEDDVLEMQIDECLKEGKAPIIQLVPRAWTPNRTTEDMEDATFLLADISTTTKGSNDNRISNIKRALKPFNGMTVGPGDRVSFNRIAGKRSLQNGYKEAQEFLDGEIVMGIGGGTCQASSTLYRALVLAGMTVEQRWPHSMIVSYVSPGFDATVTDSGKVKDLVFANNTDYPIYLYTYCDGNEARVRIFGKKPPYKISFIVEAIRKNVMAKGFTPKPDVEYRYVRTPEDEPVLYKEGRPGGACRGVVVYSDWETGQEIRRETIAGSDYEPVKPIYWVYAK